jgi:four helix bundle suffix protein
LWAKDDPEALEVRAVGKQSQTDRTDPTDPSDIAYAPWLRHRDPAVVANAIICLIHQANYLLDQQIASLERDFIQEGGYSEMLAAARIEHRRQQDRPDRSNPSDQSDLKPPPVCPLCGKPMALRTAHKGANAGSQFWGCTAYPACRGSRPLA